MNEFKQRLIDCFLQDWHGALESHTFYSGYLLHCKSVSLKPYLSCVKCISMWHVLSRFRLGVSKLNAHFLQFETTRNVRQDAYCPFCPDCLETELHFLLVCHKYNDLRVKYIPVKYYKQPSLFKLSMLLSTESENLIMRLCSFVLKHCLVGKVPCKICVAINDVKKKK
jgi:hypothetical protein